ncbi:PMS1 protein homolog 1 isoform X1 [Oncorhynchus tshawytscha]|uniref:PMS1 protein homolog 1 isoform X1 n=1 Tax=Oncorhynchus tshawytscha TaxID=74940 RepID=UPI000D09FA75|nr:PMS1 protein homolog 1 isoform X1 [Oncorhynchus tshawytscha]XP_024244575.1 PMS1 protein homolog 1 isoform X1 [Oncorhynchus tshawytscha]XP_024244576.1 PMS1 protein homolog 1 isoform X1 [Oncorhynchus tshawytscha]XP_024244577.1 PMS1 protein homolog 1 isoform X1 [Oncorhynchus tshawytscha]
MNRLPADTVRLLSSCQVINSVVNVVKELLENSLDAGALSIDIKLENYGFDRIEIRDNGSGIKAADTAVMAVQHYTSKICSHDDLEHLVTYGFRGEALGSICAVAEVAVTTKTSEDDVGTRYTLDLTGSVVSQKPSHLGQGTTVCVLKLFKNLPVRRQYYVNTKKCKEELKKVQDLLMAYAIIKPELRLTLTHNKVVLWQKAKVSDHRMALMATLGPNAVAHLLPVHHQQPEIVIDGFFPRPGMDCSLASSSNPDKTFIFVNDRPVHQKDILKVVRQHFLAQYPADSALNRYPTVMLNITVPSSTVDVNLTPDKTQILLQNKVAVLAAVETLLVSFYGPGLGSATEATPVTTEYDGGSGLHAGPSLGDCRGNAELEDSLAEHSVRVAKAPSDCSDGPLSRVVAGDQTADTSSSSSSEDWIVNLNPGDFDLAFPQLEDYMASTGTGTTNPGTAKGLERLDNHDQGHDKGKDVEQLSAVSWSRGTALTDPSTGEPLQPVKIHLATGWSSDLGQVKAKGQSSPGKKVSNAITEKRAALTAYDLINNRAMRTPLSPAALFERETRASVLQEKPTASLQDITTAVQERWKNLGEEDRKKYEDKAKKHLERYDLQTKLASDRDVREPERRLCLVSPLSRPQGQKRKVLPSNQPVLDQLFFSQPQKKRSPGPKPSQPLPFSVVTLRQRLHRLSFQSNPRPQGLRLVNRLASQSAWVVLCGRKLVLLNPFRVEEALLFKRLLENNILPAASLQNPIQLTDSILGGAEYTQSLCTMEKGSPELRGMAIFSDPRLVANGFQITLTPGSSSTERHLEVTAMADCVPFLGMEDLREILTAVLHRNAKTVKECRPLKVTNYLQGEAVRLARQLPVTLAKEDVEDILLRMQQQLEETSQACIHGQAFFHHLSDIPDTEQEALKIMSNIL